MPRPKLYSASLITQVYILNHEEPDEYIAREIVHEHATLSSQEPIVIGEVKKDAYINPDWLDAVPYEDEADGNFMNPRDLTVRELIKGGHIKMAKEEKYGIPSK